MPEDMVKVRISLGNPRWKTPYQIAGTIKNLMPTRDLLSKNLYYDDYKEEYIRILESVGLCAIQKALAEFGKNVVLLCFENVTKDENWCHRRIFAEWYEQKTGESIQELPCT